MIRTIRTQALGCLLMLGAIVALAGCGGSSGAGTVTCSPPENFPPGVDHGPQLALATATSMTIALWTTQSTIGTVAFGLDTTYGMMVTDAAPSLDHQLVLTGLQPATTYHYQVSFGGGGPLADAIFRTPPADPAAPYRFVVTGDTGSGCQEEFDAIARLQAIDPDFVLLAGDLAYLEGTAGDVRARLLVPFAPVFATTPVYAVIGNHDHRTNDGQPLLNAMVLPTNTTDGTERFYSFDWGNCHVAGLDSTTTTDPGSSQATWLDADLAASTATWKFVFFHYPLYSSSRHGSDLTVRANLEPILNARHVDIVFNAHDHDYERSYPMLAAVPTDVGSDPNYVDPQGTIYIVTGGGGQALYDNGTSSFTAISASVHHVTQVDITGSQLTLQAVQSDGTVFDTMTITKT
jgi:3',5'-cyclic AMP phosphodiesterase CpdA